MSQAFDAIVDIDESVDDNCESEIGINEIIKTMKGMKRAKQQGMIMYGIEMLSTGKGLVASLLYFLFKKCRERDYV